MPHRGDGVEVAAPGRGSSSYEDDSGILLQTERKLVQSGKIDSMSAPGGPDDFLLSDEEWRSSREYADSVEVHITTVEFDETPLDHAWTITSLSAAWDADWLARRVSEVPLVTNDGCGGHGGSHILTSRQTDLSWGADATAVELYLLVAENLATAYGFFEAVRGVGGYMAQKLRMRGAPEGWQLDELEAERLARSNVSSHYRVAVTDLATRACKTTADSKATVELATADGTVYSVDLELIDGSVCLSAIARRLP